MRQFGDKKICVAEGKNLNKKKTAEALYIAVAGLSILLCRPQTKRSAKAANNNPSMQGGAYLGMEQNIQGLSYNAPEKTQENTKISENALGLPANTKVGEESGTLNDYESSNPQKGLANVTAAEISGNKENMSETMSVMAIREEVFADVRNKDYGQYDNTSYSWWFRRRENHEPSGKTYEISDESMKDLDAYYLCEDVSEEDKVIYLTFDCGYDNGYSERILDTLKKHNAKATFFVQKAFVDKKPDLVKRMKEEGHLVGNHTVNHRSLPDLSPEELAKELYDVENAFYEATGYEMDLFFRPPEGNYSERALKIVRDLGYTTVFWSIAYYDYDVKQQPSVSEVLNHFRTYHHNGAIPLIHIISSANADALDDVLTLLEKEGYRFGELTEFAGKKK